ncbi:hypothetical protein L3X38_003208 [Prunus dulcis]|uniref:Uncharacterized protein n=1 Tax=Prunus dulcis TaxID=3755 RepID=A0AAD4ZLL6_PRUDU|nr:hypothetical protein L3X38_003208 [Prunus dulcis]
MLDGIAGLVVFNGVVVQAGDAVTILLKQVAEFNAAHVVDSMQGMGQNALAASGAKGWWGGYSRMALAVSFVRVARGFVLHVGFNGGGGGGAGNSSPLLGIWFQKVEFLHAPGDCNQAAHLVVGTVGIMFALNGC